MILSRCSCESPPWRAAASRPRPLRASARSSTSPRVRAKTSVGRAVLEVEDATQGGELVGPPHDVGHLPDTGRLALGRLLGLDADPRRLAKVCLGHAGDGAGDRGGEECRLAIQGQGRQDLLEVVGKAHVEHLIGLVEHDDLHLVEADRAAVEMVHAAPRGRDDHVHAAREAVELGRDRLARRTPAPRARPARGRTCARPPQPASRARGSARGPATWGGWPGSPRAGRRDHPRGGRPRGPRRGAARDAGASGGRRPPSCRCRSAPRPGGRGPRAGAGSRPAGPGWAPRSRARQGCSGDGGRGGGRQSPGHRPGESEEGSVTGCSYVKRPPRGLPAGSPGGAHRGASGGRPRR